MNHKYIGPFFYIDNHIVALKIETKKGETIGEYINHPVSHFNFFNSFACEPLYDYGQYPRGRVIYHINTGTFIVYLDDFLQKKDIKNEILKQYNLKRKECVFRTDEHYKHDDL